MIPSPYQLASGIYRLALRVSALRERKPLVKRSGLMVRRRRRASRVGVAAPIKNPD
jgi:hypothetical protein